MKRFFLGLFVFFSVFFLFKNVSFKAYAQVNNYTNPYSVPNVASDVKPSLHVWMQSALIDSMSALSCQLSGLDPTTPDHRCLGVNLLSGKISYLPSNNGGLIGMVSGSIGQLFNLPIHSSDYTGYLAENFGFTKAYADTTCRSGPGYCGLMPFLPLWVAFRNVSYMFLTIIFLIIGVAIMFRVKLDPRTVMSIENQLPNLIIGLILITFSYAIAGLMIDFMYVIIYVIFNFLQGQLPALSLQGGLSPQAFQGANPLEIANNLFPGTPGGFFGVVGQIAGSSADAVRNLLGIGTIWSGYSIDKTNFITEIGSFLKNLLGITGDLNFSNTLINIISAFGAFGVATQWATWTASAVGTNLGGAVAGFIVGYPAMQTILREFLPNIILYLIFLIALFLALFRVWFSLLMAFAYIILDIILAPFWILGGLIPGSEIKFEGWLRDLGANLLAFPITITMFLFASIFYQVSNNATQGIFTPPLIGGGQIKVGALLAIAILFLTPSAGQMVKDALKVKENKYGAQIGAGVAAGPSAIGKGAKTYGQSREYDPTTGSRRGLSALWGLIP